MFDLLKKKLSEFSNQLKQTIQQKTGEENAKPADSSKATLSNTPIEPIFEDKPVPITPTEKPVLKTPMIGKKPPKEKPSVSKPIAKDKRELKTKIGILEKTKAIFSGEIELGEKEIANLLDELEFALLEADVEQETAIKIVDAMRQRLVGKKISSRQNIDEFIKTEIKHALVTSLEIPDYQPFLFRIQTKKPFVFLLLGPNGAGKTTTLAKIVRLLQKNNKTAILAAADTFRAASIEQLEQHAKRLNVRLVKHTYGADPAAVGFDTIAAAKSHDIDVVLIDSAGRQETNQNLMKELEKIIRVCKPDLKLFILEGYAGQASLAQVKEFDKHLSIDGVVLTKMDTDPKGGSALSVLHELKKPIFFIGTGQGYDDLEEFELENVLDKIV